MNIETSFKEFQLAYQFRLESSTLKTYIYAIKQLLHYSEKSFDKITKGDIRNWLAYLSTGNYYKPATFNTKIASLKTFYQYCEEEDIISANPAKSIKYVYVEDKLPRYLLKEQLTQLRVFLEGRIQERAILEILYATGVRISELLAMKKSDVNWNERLIVIKEGKNNEGRIVLFTASSAEYLKAYLDSRTDDLPNLFLIYNTEGTLSNSVNVVEEWFRYYSKCLGFKVAPHVMRHTFAAHLARKGMPLECIQELLGHSKYQTTRIYAKLYNHARKEMYDEWM